MNRPAAALFELSSCVDPAALRNRAAQDAIVRTTKALRKRIKAEKWPMPHQVAGVAYCALARDRALIADDMGVGKTATALLRVLLAGHVPALVICPPNVLHNWKQEAEWWIPGIAVHRLDKVARPVPPPGWPGMVVTTWDLLRYHSRALIGMRPRIVIADECHYALHSKTLRTRHFEAIARRAPHLLLLSGTPLVNRPKDLWRLLNIIDPNDWPEATVEGFKALNDDTFDSGHQDRLTRRIRAFMLRRLKGDALTDLTAKKHSTLTVRLPAKSMTEYREVEDRFATWLDRHVRAKLSPDDYTDDEGNADDDAYEDAVEEHKTRTLASADLVKIGHLRRIVGLLKAPLAAGWLTEAVNAGEPVVAFAEHQAVIAAVSQALTDRGVRFGVIDGKTTKTRRHSRVKEFQSGAIDVLLCSQAAREGITLTRARHVLQIERWWTSAAEDQGADRLHRIGQKRDVTVWMMIAEDTVDERMDQVVSKKRRVTARTVDAQGAAAG